VSVESALTTRHSASFTTHIRHGSLLPVRSSSRSPVYLLITTSMFQRGVRHRWVSHGAAGQGHALHGTALLASTLTTIIYNPDFSLYVGATNA
jgi:hypothetical protein